MDFRVDLLPSDSSDKLSCCYWGYSQSNLATRLPPACSPYGRARPCLVCPSCWCRYCNRAGSRWVRNQTDGIWRALSTVSAQKSKPAVPTRSLPGAGLLSGPSSKYRQGWECRSQLEIAHTHRWSKRRIDIPGESKGESK